MASKTHLGRYEVKRKLGKGAMALVLRGYDPHFKRDVAIKVLHRKFGNSPEIRQRFVREARTIAAIDHPAIVPVLDAGQDEELTFVVLRLMEGGSLHERIQQGALSPEEILPILERVGTALDAAHEQNIIHRDLKPENILFDQYNKAYLGDFGIVKIQDQEVSITQDALVGTPAYMSPEQVRGDVDIDGRSDLYSLGAVLFEMLTGQLPFEGDTSMQMAMRHITEPVPRLHNFSRPWQKLIDKAMAKEREARFQSGAELAAAFAAVANETSAPLLPVRQRHKLSLALFGLLATCFFVWGIWGGFGTTEATNDNRATAVVVDTTATMQVRAVQQTADALATLEKQFAAEVQMTEEAQKLAEAQSATEQAIDAITLTAQYAEISATLVAEPTLSVISTVLDVDREADAIGIVYAKDTETSSVKERNIVRADRSLVIVQIDDELGDDLAQYASFYKHRGTEVLYNYVARQRMEIVLSAGSDLYIDAGKYTDGIEVLLDGSDDILFSFDQCVSLQYTSNELTANCYGGICRYQTPDETNGILAAGDQLQLNTTRFMTTTRPIPLEQGQADRTFILGADTGVSDAERCLDDDFTPPPTATPRSTSTPRSTTSASPTTAPPAGGDDINTPRPANINTPRPVNTNTPRPANTNTPRPANTNTPRPANTNTPRPANTNTPRPANTNTPWPTASNTPRSTVSNTPRPTVTSTLPPTNTPTLRPATPRPPNTSTPIPPPTNTPVPPPTNTPVPPPTNTSAPPTNTPIPPTSTSVPPTRTPRPLPATNTPAKPTNTPVPPPTNTPVPPPTNTPVPPPTNTPVPPPTNTPVPPPTNTPVPPPTNTPIPPPTNTPVPPPTSTPVPPPTDTPVPPPTSVKPTDTPTPPPVETVKPPPTFGSTAQPQP